MPPEEEHAPYSGYVTRILVLGGSWFLGSTLVEAALDGGMEVTTFRRGLSGNDIPGVRLIRGDRSKPEDVAKLTALGPWDAVIDTSSYVPRETLAIARALEPVADRYVLLSTVSVYADWPTAPLTDDSSVLDCPPDAGPDYGYDGDPGPSRYGFGKAGCERAVREVFGDDRSVFLRPGVILGPHEYVGRLEWWLRRMQAGGRVVVPGRPNRVVQPVDVRDVAAFALRTVYDRLSGSFNVAARGRDTMGDLLRACNEVTAGSATLEWITDEEWLVAQEVQQWTELPLWRTYPGAWAVDSRRAYAAGFTSRSIRETVIDTWAWLESGSTAVAHERAAELGITSEREQAILALWDAYQLDHCGAE